MNILQILTLVEEVLSIYNQIKADGTLQKLQDAGGAIEGELANNSQLKDLESKIQVLFPHAAAK